MITNVDNQAWPERENMHYLWSTDAGEWDESSSLCVQFITIDLLTFLPPESEQEN